MYRPILPTVAVALALVLPAPASAAEKVTDRDRFDLWTDCKPLDLVVSVEGKDASFELTNETISTAVRSRLRAARIYDAHELFQHLAVSAHIVGKAIHVRASFRKFLEDPVSNRGGFATTWSRYATGTHGDDEGAVLSAISKFADEFIDEFLRVNATACGNSN